MRRNILVIFFIIGTILLCGCGSTGQAEETTEAKQVEETTEAKVQESFYLEELYSSGSVGGAYVYYRNTVTDVMYIWIWNGNRGGLTEMSDPETGKPLTYARYKELATQKTE